jgi:hypothetical protein
LYPQGVTLCGQQIVWLIREPSGLRPQIDLPRTGWAHGVPEDVLAMQESDEAGDPTAVERDAGDPGVATD